MKSSDFRGGLKPNIEHSRSFIKHKNLTNFVSETIQPMMFHEGKAKTGTSKAVEYTIITIIVKTFTKNTLAPPESKPTR